MATSDEGRIILRSAGILFLLAVGYVLLPIPVIALMNHGVFDWVSGTYLGTAFDLFFWPLERLYDHWNAYQRFIDWCHDTL